MLASLLHQVVAKLDRITTSEATQMHAHSQWTKLAASYWSLTWASDRISGDSDHKHSSHPRPFKMNI